MKKRPSNRESRERRARLQTLVSNTASSVSPFPFLRSPFSDADVALKPPANFNKHREPAPGPCALSAAVRGANASVHPAVPLCRRGGPCARPPLDDQPIVWITLLFFLLFFPPAADRQAAPAERILCASAAVIGWL